jgi:hypothetical protein
MNSVSVYHKLYFWISTMPRHTKSEEQKTVEFSRAKRALEAAATEAYSTELQKKKEGLPYMSARAICEKFTGEHQQKTGKIIPLIHTTILRRLGGQQTRAQANETKSWLTTEERKVVIEFIIETGAQGFPLSHKRLKVHVDEICRNKYGEKFPEKGVGKRWTHRFLVKHSNEIMMAWSTQLEDKRGRAVNLNTKAAWDKLLASTVEKYGITAPLMYAVDETGVTGQTGQKERVMGAKKKGLHYQQVGGSRENTTVLVTICADGSSLPPAVIFKGKAYQTDWNDNNPSKAS